MQSKLIFNGIHKSYDNSDRYIFEHNEMLMDKPICFGFVVLELQKLLVYDVLFCIKSKYC